VVKDIILLFSWKPLVHLYVHKTPPQVPIVCHMNEFHPFIHYFLKPTLTSTFHMHKYLRGPLPFRLQDKICTHFWSLSYKSQASHLDLIILNVWREGQIMTVIIQFSPSASHILPIVQIFSTFNPRYLLRFILMQNDNIITKCVVIFTFLDMRRQQKFHTEW